MSEWNFDMSAAPKGEQVERRIPLADGKERVSHVWEVPSLILASKCGKVTTSHWMHGEERWQMFAKGEEPLAWLAWPTHPSRIGEKG